MADDNDDGSSYLAALRQSIAPQAAAAASARSVGALSPANAQNQTAERITQPASSDKRNSPRLRCTGNVRVQERGKAASTWATFTDIGLQGCYVVSAAPYPLATLVDLKLEANGFHLNALGEVRVSYPGLGMGISFTKISNEGRERLHELVRSISRPSVILTSRLATPPVSMAQPDPPSINDPGAVLRSMQNFFEDRHMMGRDDFLRILRKTQ